MSRDRRPPGFVIGDDAAMQSSATILAPHAPGLLKNIAGTVWVDINLADGTATEIDGELSAQGSLGKFLDAALSGSVFVGTWHYPNSLLPGTDFAAGGNVRLDYQRTSFTAGTTHLFPSANTEGSELYRVGAQRLVATYNIAHATILNFRGGLSAAFRSDYYRSSNGIRYAHPEVSAELRHQDFSLTAFVARQLGFHKTASLTYGGLRVEYRFD